MNPELKSSMIIVRQRRDAFGVYWRIKIRSLYCDTVRVFDERWQALAYIKSFISWEDYKGSALAYK